jgi:hypothetical protein
VDDEGEEIVDADGELSPVTRAYGRAELTTRSRCKNGTSNMPHVPMPTQDVEFMAHDAAPARIQMFHAAKHMRQR